MFSRKMALLLTVVLSLALATFAAANDEDEKETEQAYLGIRMQRLEGGLAEALSLKEDSGVLVGQVMEGSPADDGDLKQGDIIVRVDGTDVGTPSELGELIRSKSKGERVNLHILRNGDSRTLTVTLGGAPERTRTFSPKSAPPPPGAEGDLDWIEIEDGVRGSRGFLGVMTQSLSDDLGEYFGVKDGKGALVSEVVEKSPADKLGLRAGDVITRVDGNKIDSPSDLIRVMQEIESEREIQVVWLRDKRERKGEVAVEMREGGSGPGMDRKMARLRNLPRRFDRLLPRARAEEGELRELKDTLAELRAEMEALRMEMQQLKQDSRSK
jgi:S1-C subfamily serine protease